MNNLHPHGRGFGFRGTGPGWVGAIALAAAMVSSAAAVTVAEPPPPVDPPAGLDADRGPRPDLDGRPRGRGRGPATEADMERLITVIQDISPEWASSLRSRLAEDPDAAREDFRRHGRRLFGLVMLKERNPPLYAVRVAELALKKGMKERAIEYHRVLAGDTARADVLATQIREMAAESVDLELRARAMELEALDQAVRELREKLLGEVAEREARIETVWRSLLDRDPSNDEDDPLQGLDDRRRPPLGVPTPPPAGSDRS